MKSKMMSVGLIALLSLSGVSAYGQNPDDIYWDNSISPTFPGVMGVVRAMTVYEGRLVVAGMFSEAGGMSVGNVVAWDGTSWSSLGSGVNGQVNALTVFDGRLIAGGQFTMAGDVETYSIAAWDGNNWSPLGSGVDGWVQALTVYDGKLIAGGNFVNAGGVPANRIAAWDGDSWSAMGEGVGGVAYPWVFALAEFNGILVAGGNFAIAGETTANSIAAWNGSDWTSLGTGTNSLVWALAIHNNDLIAGGQISIAGVSIAHIASWNGVEWSALGTWTGDFPQSMSFETFDGMLIAGGSFGYACMNQVWVWNGSSWSECQPDLGQGDFHNHGFALASYQGLLIVGGSFETAGELVVNSIVSWNGSSWLYLDQGYMNRGLNGRVTNLAVYDAKLIVTGEFTKVDDLPVHQIAAWDGDSWSPLGPGIDISDPAMILYDGCLITASPYGASAWNGSAWTSLGAGVENLLPEQIPWQSAPVAFAVRNDTLFAGWNAILGDWENSWAVGVVLSWDGTSWDYYADADSGIAIRGIAVFQGRLVWSPSLWLIRSWDGFGHGRDGGCLAIWDDKLLRVSHNFAFDEMPCASRETITLSAWDGTDEMTLFERSTSGCYPPGPVDFTALGIHDSRLVVAGQFDAMNIAQWDGSAWSGLGSGVDGPVSAVIQYGGKLMVGGDFRRAGGKFSRYLAAWTKRNALCGDADGSGEVNLVDIVYHVNWIFAGGPAPIDEAAGDCNCDSRPNIGDAVYLVNYLYLSGPAPCASCP